MSQDAGIAYQPPPPGWQPPPPSLVALQAASQALARAESDEDGILSYLQAQVRRLLPPSRIHILLFLDDQSLHGAAATSFGSGTTATSFGSTLLYAWNREGEPLPPSYFETPAAQGIIGWLRETRESLLVGDFDRDWAYLPARPSYNNPHPPRSAIFVPLLVADEALGAISVQSDQADIYTADHLWQLRILANQSAAAISAARLLQSERWRANQLQTLAEITRSVVSILDQDRLLTHVVDVIEQAFGYYHVQIFVVAKGSDYAVFRASSGHETHELWRRMGRSVKIDDRGIIPWVLSHGEPLAAPDVSVDPLYVPDDPHLLPDTRSEIAIPLKLNEEILGVLDVQSDKLDAFGEEDLFILNALGDAVALAVANAQLYAHVQEDAWITSALLEVAAATSRLTELPDVVQTIVRITPLLTGVRTCAIWLRRQGKGAGAKDFSPHIIAPVDKSGLRSVIDGVYEPAAQWGVPDELTRIFHKHPLLASENRVLSELEAQMQPEVVRPPHLDEALAPIVAQTLLADAVVFLPLVAKAQLIGVIAVSLEEKNAPPSETRLPLLKGIADQAAAAIENAHLIAAQREEAWVSTALLQVAEAMGRARDLDETLAITARLTVALSGLDRCTLLLREGQSLAFQVRQVAAIGGRFPNRVHEVSANGRAAAPFAHGMVFEPEQLPLLHTLLNQRAPLLLTEQTAIVAATTPPIGRVRSRDALPLVTPTANLATGDATIGATADATIGALVAAPLIATDEVVGVMLVDEAQPRRIYNARLLDILNGIASQAAVAIERARLQHLELARQLTQQRIDAELGVAHNIQRGFLPEEIPPIEGYELAALWEPARQIGGDFYDFFTLPDGRLGIVIADVADKGIPAALYMALSRTAMRLVARRNASPATALQRVNTAIIDNSYSDMFVTIYYAVIDPESHLVTYASGGHGLALVARQDKASTSIDGSMGIDAPISIEGSMGIDITFLRGKGTALGILPDIDIHEHTTHLHPGDYLVIYTDGVTDAVNPDLEDFGQDRLLTSIRQHGGASAAEMLAQIHADVRAWEGEAPPFDDFTLIVIRRKP